MIKYFLLASLLYVFVATVCAESDRGETALEERDGEEDLQTADWMWMFPQFRIGLGGGGGGMGGGYGHGGGYGKKPVQKYGWGIKGHKFKGKKSKKNKNKNKNKHKKKDKHKKGGWHESGHGGWQQGAGERTWQTSQEKKGEVSP